MKRKQHVVAGTMESSDIFIEIYPDHQGLEIELRSVVAAQFGDSIRRVIEDELRRGGVNNIRLRANDRGALDCVIRARVQTALARLKEVAAQ